MKNVILGMLMIASSTSAFAGNACRVTMENDRLIKFSVCSNGKPLPISDDLSELTVIGQLAESGFDLKTRTIKETSVVELIFVQK
ncbi:MAG: hypothetical protein KA715_02275 [Xanthomonadaceae bacterium]|nr:hypothetical protein [Xanthomonadaceae bacterium]